MVAEYLILHCSDTEDGPTLSWPAIRRYHTGVKGWSDIGYHYGLERYKDRMILLPGRRPTTYGAHCQAAGRNKDSIGLCVVGDFDRVAPTPSVYDAIVNALALIALMHGIHVDRIRAHREFDDRKSCPGSRIDMNLIRDLVGARMSEMSEIGRHWEIGDYQ